MRDSLRTYRALAILVSALNFLFFLLVRENISYLYFRTSPHIFFLLLLKFSFAGFSLALLLFPWIKERIRSLSLYWLLTVLSYLVLLTACINYFEMPVSARYIVSFSIIFVPAFLYGLIYAIIMERLPGPFNQTLFYLLIGSATAVFVYTYVLAYTHFLFIYVALFIIFQILLLMVGPRRSPPDTRFQPKLFTIQLILLLATLTCLSFKPFFGQIYLPSSEWTSEDVRTLSIKGPYGVLDVLRRSDSNAHYFLSDNQSPSTIVMKGHIDMVQEQAKIPYMIKPYNNALIIGVGGGQDLVAALHYGTKHITAVEIDKQRVHLMRTAFKEHSNSLFFDPRITVVIQSGRQFLKMNREKFDLIVIQRPWTVQVTPAYVHQTSDELFTEEALEAYLNALTEDGVIYLGWPTSNRRLSTMQQRMFALVKSQSDRIGNHVAIFHWPYVKNPKEHSILAALIGKEFDAASFYASHQAQYTFLYSPTIGTHQNQNEAMGSLVHETHTRKYIDKNFYGALSKRELNKNLAQVIGSLLLILFVLCRLGYPNHATYFYLGVGYELVGVLFAVWLSSFIGNFITMLPVVLLIYFLLGSVGYLHSTKVGTRSVALMCLAISGIFLLIWQQDLFATVQRPSMFHGIVIVGLFVLVSYLITFPFGHLVSAEKHMRHALSTDYIGSLFSIVGIFLLGNLDYLLFLCAFIYTSVGALLLFTKSPSRT